MSPTLTERSPLQLTNLERFSPDDQAFIERAYQFAYKAHEGVFRKSGEPYITHPVAVAQIVINTLHLDARSVAAALLHDVIEDVEGMTRETIEANFGQEVAALVDGLTKIESISTSTDTPAARAGKNTYQKEAETIRKLLLTIGDDPRVILIKLADRLHNIRTVGYLKPEAQERMAHETLDIFAPLANRLGIWQVKWELEDLSFRCLNPEKYREIADALGERRADREASLKRVTERLSAELAHHKIEAQISERPKHIYSIYRKMVRKGVGFDEIYDARAVRVIVADIATCYAALGVVHQLWRPISGQFDDYIAAPKENSYRSLHTAVRDDENRTLEVQIRTQGMHDHAEYGVAAHWRYKEGIKRDESFEIWIDRMRAFMDDMKSDEDGANAQDYVESFRNDVLDGALIYVYTPKGDMINLREGATPIDFAYAVHTEIGHRCRGAKVNGQIVPLSQPLKSGDHVEITTSPTGGPTLAWLSEPYTYTTRARSKIRAWFRKQGRPQNIITGREVVKRAIDRIDPSVSLETVAHLFGMQTDEFLASVGYGDIRIVQIEKQILEQEHRRQREQEELKNLAPELNSPQSAPIDASQGISLADGDKQMLMKLARCCSPAKGDAVIGFVTRGKGVTVHRADCPNIINLSDSERNRLINVSWEQAASQTFPVRIEVKAFDRPGLLRDVTGVVADWHINLTDVQNSVKGNMATCVMLLHLESVDHLPDVLQAIEQVPNVTEARRRITGLHKDTLIEAAPAPKRPVVTRQPNGKVGPELLRKLTAEQLKAESNDSTTAKPKAARPKPRQPPKPRTGIIPTSPSASSPAAVKGVTQPGRKKTVKKTAPKRG